MNKEELIKYLEGKKERLEEKRDKLELRGFANDSHYGNLMYLLGRIDEIEIILNKLKED